MGERKSTIVRLEPGEMARCMGAKCQAIATHKALTPKSGPGSRGGVVMTRYLCGNCVDKFQQRFPKSGLVSEPAPPKSKDS